MDGPCPAGRRSRKKKLSATDLLGSALAAGIGYADFCRMTSGQWAAAARAVSEAREASERQAWERARLVGAAALAPYMRKGQKADPRKLFPMPWDGGQDGEGAKPLSRSEAKTRFDQLTKR